MSTHDLNERIWHNTASAAEYTGYSATTVLRALEAGELAGHQRSKRARWRIHRDDLDAWLRGGAA